MLVVHDQHGGVAAGAHALAFDQGELAVFGGLAVVDAQLALEVFAGTVAIAQGTGQVGADGDLVLADGLDVEHVVERGDFLDRDGRNANVVGHVFDDFGSQPALLFLRDGKRGHDGGLPLVGRELGQFTVDFLVGLFGKQHSLNPGYAGVLVTVWGG